MSTDWELGKKRSRTIGMPGADSTPRYAILRLKKLKTGGNIAAMQQHIWRERETPNADPQQQQPELLYGQKDAQKAVESRLVNLGIKPRSNAVRSLDILLTASPDYFRDDGHGPGEWHEKRMREWAQGQVEYVSRRFGSENVAQVTLHLDEATPHIHATVVPITQDGRLSARDVVGNRSKLRDLQTDYAAAMNPLGLDRGVEGSRATHQTVKRWYAETEKALEKDPYQKFDLEKPKLLEPAGAFAEREVNRYINEVTRPLAARLKKAKENSKRLADIEPAVAQIQQDRDDALEKSKFYGQLAINVTLSDQHRLEYRKKLEAEKERR